jgi:hypothetical protein
MDRKGSLKMKIALSIPINVSMIEKERLVKGKKGTYLDAQVFVEMNDDGSFAEDEYGNIGMITQAVSKEERLSGVLGPILGNLKEFWREEGRSVPKTSAPPAETFDDFDDDIPF